MLPLLVEDGWRVRCLARHPENLLSRVPAGVEVVRGDVLDAVSLPAAMRGVEAAYYLVHSMGATGDFEKQDRRAAKNFAAAASAAGVRRIIYLGGLGGDDPGLSAHLRSRHEGERLRAHGVAVIEFRASIIIGSGSLSFEVIRALVERLPVMVTSRWVRTTAQPIAIGDVLAYLRAALAVETGGRSLVVEIGGPDRVSYGELMHEYAAARAAAGDDCLSAADAAAVEFVAGPGDAAVCPGRAQAGGKPAPPDRGARTIPRTGCSRSGPSV